MLSCSNLSNNRITDIEEGTFEGASGVNELILTSNRLENIHHRMLKGLSGLRTLWVHTHTMNMQTHIKCASYYSDVHVLMFSSQIHSIPLFMCVCLSSMLRSNRISCVSNSSFVGLSSVRLLSLYDNQITSMNPGAFDTLHSLSTL